MSRFRFYRDENGYGLHDQYTTQRPLRISFLEQAYIQRLKQAGRKSELIARAIKPRPLLKVLDCTAGLAKEAFLLAHLGCEVTLLERSVVISEMLAEAIENAKQDSFLADAASRLSLKNQDANDFLATTSDHFDVIYIDPMFPAKKGSAAVSGDMQILQRFLGVDEDATSLLERAVAMESQRVVVKRPADGGWTPPITPTHIFKGKSSSYELFGA